MKVPEEKPETCHDDGNINFANVRFSQNEIDTLASISGSDRLHLFFQMFRERNVSTDSAIFELREIRDAFLGSFLLGTLTMGIPACMSASESFRRRGETAMYTHRVLAVKDMHSATWRGFFKYGSRWGWRVSFLFTSMVAAQSAFWIYTDQFRLSHYVAGATVAGAIYRANKGLKGVLVGGLFGACVLGLGAGSLLTLNYSYFNHSDIVAAQNRRHLFYLKTLNKNQTN